MALVDFQQALLLTLDGLDHGVEGSRQIADGVGTIDGDGGVEITAGDAVGGLDQLADGQKKPMHQEIGGGKAQQDRDAANAQGEIIHPLHLRLLLLGRDAHGHEAHKPRSSGRFRAKHRQADLEAISEGRGGFAMHAGQRRNVHSPEKVQIGTRNRASAHQGDVLSRVVVKGDEQNVAGVEQSLAHELELGHVARGNRLPRSRGKRVGGLPGLFAHHSRDLLVHPRSPPPGGRADRSGQQRHHGNDAFRFQAKPGPKSRNPRQRRWRIARSRWGVLFRQGHRWRRHGPHPSHRHDAISS